MDGWVIIGTQLDTKQLEADIKNAKKELTQFQKEEEKLLKEKGKIEVDLSEYDKLTQKVEESKQKIRELKDERKSLFVNGKISANDFGTYEGLTTQIEEAERQQSLLTQQVEKADTKYLNNISKLEKINVQLKDNRLQQGLVNNKIDEANTKLTQAKGYENISKQMKNVAVKTSDVVKQIGRWALAIFSIRGAYSFLTRASSTLAQYNKEYGANLEYIRFALAQAIAPVLQFLVNLAYRLLTYINYIAQAWFGVNLFSKASAKNFQKMAGSAKSIKESLQTAGFDEMNILTDTSSSSSGGAGGGVPSFDLANPKDVPIPSWLKWIAENKDLILAVLAGIAAALIAIHLGLSLIQALGIGLMVGGIVYAIEGLLAYLEDPTWENFGKIIQGIGVAISGLGIIIAAATGSWVVAIVGAIVLIVGSIIRYWDEIKSFLQSGIDWLTEKSDWVHEMFGDTIGNIYDTFVQYLQLILNWFDNTFASIKGILDGIIKFVKGVFTGDWKMAWEGIKDIFINIWNIIKSTFTTVFNYIKSTVVTVGQTVGNIIAGVFKAVVNAVLATIETVLNSPINAVNTLIDVINTLPGVQIGTIPTFNLPRLKVGGIVNLPSKGVPIGGAYTGEAGAEGVIPLTDSQAMETLGEAIGRYITINANIVNSMNGRVLSRQLQQIRGDQDFAYNK